MKKIIISGALFDKSYGILSVINCSPHSMTIESEHIIEHPYPEIAIIGKGITGIAVDGSHVWACFSNVIVKINLDDFSIADTITDFCFNDLHSIMIHDNHLYVANTGNESIDIINLQNKKLERFDFLGGHLRNIRPNYSQDQDTKPHIHHISSVTINDEDELIVGLVRQQRILNLSKWKWLSAKESSPLHDVDFIDGRIWYTTVGGEISNSEQTWKLSDYQSTLGWTRGLAVIDNGMYVGTTAIRESNHNYYEIITDSTTKNTGAKVCYIPFSNEDVSVEIELPNAENRKVFSIELLD